MLHLLSFALIPPVLEPDLHLSLRQPQHGRKLLTLVSSQVFLHCKPALKFVNLCVWEKCSGPSLFVPCNEGGRTAISCRRKGRRTQHDA